MVELASVLIIPFWLGARLFEPKWTSVSAVTVTNGYTSPTTATLNDPHSSSKSRRSHSQLHPRLSKLCRVSTLLDRLLRTRGEVTGGGAEKSGHDCSFCVFFLTNPVQIFTLNHPAHHQCVSAQQSCLAPPKYLNIYSIHLLAFGQKCYISCRGTLGIFLPLFF